jgi:hypothetical protein
MNAALSAPTRWLTTLCLAAIACDGREMTTEPPLAATRAVKFWEVNATTRWNRRALDLVGLRPPANGQAATSRILTYLSIAQYRAVLAANEGKAGNNHPSVPAAVGAASVQVLSAFFPLDAAQIESMFESDLAAPGWPGAKNQDPESGESIGRAVGTAVLGQAATDNYLVVSPGTPPVGPGYWTSAAAPIVRSLHGTRPFFLASPDAIRSPPPPAFGSAAFLADLAEVRAISDTRTA